MALTQAQKDKFFKIRKNQGPEAAEAYRTRITGGASVTPNAPAGTPPVVDLRNPQSVLNYQAQVNQNTVDTSTPNVINDFGTRTVDRNPETGRITVNEQLTGANRELYEQGVQGQERINETFATQMGRVASQAPFDPRAGQQQSNVYQNSAFRDSRSQIDAPANFRDMQGQVYQNALADYQEATRGDISYRRDLLEQQMINEGVPRDSAKYQRAMEQFNKQADATFRQVNRDAYRDSMDVGSQAFQDQLSGQGQEFDQSRAMQTDEWSQGIQGQAQQFGQTQQLNDRAERFAQSEYMMPHQIAGQYMGAQGQFRDPNMGAVQQINAPTVDALGYGTSYAGQAQQGRQFQSRLDFDRWAQQGDWDTSRANARSGNSGNSLADRMTLLNQQAQIERDNYAYQQGFGGSPAPATSFSDVAGSAAANAATGFIGGMYGAGRR
jgi:hypothetical protein